MADNVTLSLGTGDGALIATDENVAEANAQYQYVKLVFGGNNTFTKVDTANPIPVDLRTDNLAGNLDVNIAASAATLTVQGTVTADAGAGTFTTSDTATLADDAAFTPATSRVMMAGATFDDNLPDSVDEGDGGALRMSANRNLYTTLRDAAGNERGANVNANFQLSVAVDNNPVLGAGTNNIGDVDVLSVLPGTGANNLGKAEDAAHTNSDVGVMALAVRTDTPVNRSGLDGDYEPLQVSGGRLWARATIDAALPAGTNNIGDVDILSLPNEGQQTMANSISVAVASDQSALTVAQATAASLKGQVEGTTAHDAAAPTNPLVAGARANLNEPTAVAAGDATHLWSDLLGRLVVLPGHANPEAPVQAGLTASGDTTVIAAPGVGVSHHICKGSVHNSGAAAITVQLRNGTAGAVVWEAELAADGGGSVFDFGARGWKQTANTLLAANLSAVGTVSLNISEWYIAA